MEFSLVHISSPQKKADPLFIQLDRKQIEFLAIQANDYVNMDSERKRSGKIGSSMAKWIT